MNLVLNILVSFWILGARKPIYHNIDKLTEAVTLKHLTEPRWALQPQGTKWFSRIGLFVVQVIILGLCRRPIEFLTSWHPCGRLSKIPNSQIHKVEKWKILSNFRRKDFFVISHGHKGRFFVVIWPKKTLGHIKYWPRIDLFFSKNQNFDPKHTSKVISNPSNP